ncbi:hypothetical protein MHO82_18185 [Vibrio sp. Of7-15]|uniref:hypothetical protein n=1 Tax=Vibrio sp. Of7-15 TaxID=2724879 RepID=UPI001EF3C2A5|nr:hypothetical protein [Vibrio sp. Of7-15]MCG7498802.1 hypothetical protein [Vibrio sp. Of7-15]
MSYKNAIEDQFYNENRSNTLPFVINDAVKIVAGEFTNRFGSVVSFNQQDGYLEFVVELGDGSGDVKVKATEMQLSN